MYATICGRFCLNKGGVAGYVNRMKVKYTAKWGVQIAGMIFQTHSRAYTTKCGAISAPHFDRRSAVQSVWAFHVNSYFFLFNL